jgi:hypothetical protein
MVNLLTPLANYYYGYLLHFDMNMLELMFVRELFGNKSSKPVEVKYSSLL